MKIFNLNKKKNLQTNLKACLEFTKEKIKEQQDEIKIWEKNTIKELEKIELNEDSEFTLLKTISEKMDIRKKMFEKINDLGLAELILEQLNEKYGEKKCK